MRGQCYEGRVYIQCIGSYGFHATCINIHFPFLPEHNSIRAGEIYKERNWPTPSSSPRASGEMSSSVRPWPQDALLLWWVECGFCGSSSLIKATSLIKYVPNVD